MRLCHTGTGSVQRMLVVMEAQLATTLATTSRHIVQPTLCKTGSSSQLSLVQLPMRSSQLEARVPQRPGARYPLEEVDYIMEVCLSMERLVQSRFVSLAEVPQCFSRLDNPSRLLAVMASRTGMRGSAPSLEMRLAP